MNGGVYQGWGQFQNSIKITIMISLKMPITKIILTCKQINYNYNYLVITISSTLAIIIIFVNYNDNNNYIGITVNYVCNYTIYHQLHVSECL